MNRKYRHILRLIDKGPRPVQFSGDDAAPAAELIGGGFAVGEAIDGQDGVTVLAVSTGLTFEGRRALDEATFFGRLERMYDLLIGVIVGAVVGSLSALGGALLVKAVLK
jgi:hypothetical protein